MTTLTLRNTKGSPLTNTELDANFSNLNTTKAETASPTFTGTISAATITATGVVTGSSFSGAGTGLTGTAASLSIGGNAATITSQANSATITASTTATANQIVLRDASGDDYRRYGYSSYLNMSHAVDTARNTDTVFYSSTDDFIRKTTASSFRTSLNVPTRTGGDASGTWSIAISGNAATVSSISSVQVTTALGFTPYNATNPAGYITSTGSVTGAAGSVTNAVTFTSSGGAAAGTTYNGSITRTIDYSTLGAAASGHNHTYDVNNAWLRYASDASNVKLYGNTRQMVFRTDGTTEFASGVGPYAFAWMYGGDTAANRVMLLSTAGDMWSLTNGWLSTALAGKQNTGSYLTAEADTLATVTARGAIATTSITIGTGGGYVAGSIYSDVSWGMLFRAKQASPTNAEYRWATSTDTELMRLTTGGNLTIPGTFSAVSKSFLINHPTRPGMQLRYGSLEGPENGVYIRGRLNSNKIELPEYWTKLVDPDSITVNLTAIGNHQDLYVVGISNNIVTIANGNILNKTINCFYTVFAERCDIEKLVVEI